MTGQVRIGYLYHYCAGLTNSAMIPMILLTGHNDYSILLKIFDKEDDLFIQI